MVKDERRKYERLNSIQKVVCRKYVLDGKADVPVEVKLRDTGGGGVLIESRKEYKVGDFLKLEVDLPGWYRFKGGFYRADAHLPEPLIILVEVRRAEKISKGKYRIGASFAGIDEGHRDALISFIQSKLGKVE